MVDNHQNIYESIIKDRCRKKEVVYYIFEKFGGEKTICHTKDLFENITVLEKEALKNIKKGDRVLDIGAGSGRISAYLQKRGCDVTALDKSKTICEVLRKRGIKKVINADVLCYSPEIKFTTALFIKTYSIFGKKQRNIANFFQHLKEKVIDRHGRLFVILDNTKSGKSEIIKRRFIYAGKIGSWLASFYPSFRDLMKSAQDTGFRIKKTKKNKRGEYFLILERSR